MATDSNPSLVLIPPDGETPEVDTTRPGAVTRSQTREKSKGKAKELRGTNPDDLIEEIAILGESIGPNTSPPSESYLETEPTRAKSLPPEPIDETIKVQFKEDADDEIMPDLRPRSSIPPPDDRPSLLIHSKALSQLDQLVASFRKYDGPHNSHLDRLRAPIQDALTPALNNRGPMDLAIQSLLLILTSTLTLVQQTAMNRDEFDESLEGIRTEFEALVPKSDQLITQLVTDHLEKESKVSEKRVMKLVTDHQTRESNLTRTTCEQEAR